MKSKKITQKDLKEREKCLDILNKIRNLIVKNHDEVLKLVGDLWKESYSTDFVFNIKDGDRYLPKLNEETFTGNYEITPENIKTKIRKIPVKQAKLLQFLNKNKNK